MGNFPLRGVDRHAWNETYESDLIALRRRETPDHFSRWFINTVVPYFHRIVGWRFKVRVHFILSRGFLIDLLETVGTSARQNMVLQRRHYTPNT